MRCGDWFSNTVDPDLRLTTCGCLLTGKDHEDTSLIVDRSRGGKDVLKFRVCSKCKGKQRNITYLPWPSE